MIPQYITSVFSQGISNEVREASPTHTIIRAGVQKD